MAITLDRLTSGHFLPSLSGHKECTSVVQGTLCSVRVEIVFQLEIQILIRIPCYRRNSDKEWESSLCANVEPYIWWSGHLRTTSGSILATLIPRLQGGELGGSQTGVRRGFFSGFFCTFWTWALHMYYWVKKKIKGMNIKFKNLVKKCLFKIKQ